MAQGPGAANAAAPGPASLAEARDALAAIADYYSRLEPSSPTLPLVRQAHQLIGKSFIEVMSILVPTQMEKAAFQIGTDQVFELPVGKTVRRFRDRAPAAESRTGVPSDGANCRARLQRPVAGTGHRLARAGTAILPRRRALQPRSDAVRARPRPRRAGFHGRAEGRAAESGPQERWRRQVKRI